MYGQRIKALFRWLARRDGESSASRAGGYIQGLQPVVAIVIGVYSGLAVALAVFLALWACRAFVGYIDLHMVGLTRYINDYTTRLAPGNVHVIRRKARK